MEQVADGRYGPWVLIEQASTFRIDGGNPNSTDGIMYTHPRSVDAPFTLQVGYVKLRNDASGTPTLGFGVRIHKSAWKAGQWTHGTTTYTDDTTDFQSSATNDAPLETLVNGDGFVVQCMSRFSSIALNIGTVSTGTPTRVIEYTTSSGWATMTAVLHTGSGANYASGEQILVWIPPSDWMPIAALHGTNLTVGWYGIRVRATTAPTIAGIASSLTIHRLYGIVTAIAQHTQVDYNFGGLYAPLEPLGDGFVMLNTNLSNKHTCMALVRARG